MKKWFNVINKADHAEVWIYEQIGEDYWDGSGVTAKGFQKELSGIKASQIDLHINSPGGQVFDGITIHNLIKQHPANVTTYIDGLAASIASVIALAGDRVVMAENALFMIHKASGMVFGNSDDMRDFADKLDKVNGSIATTYTTKTGKDEIEIDDLMKAETWLNAKDALAAGFVDEISGETDMTACAKFIPVMQKANFHNIPDDITAKKEKPTARNLERVLRDAGCSTKQAKEILAKGFVEDTRDADQSEPIAPVKLAPRDVAPGQDKKKDPIADLLIRAEIMAPTKTL